MSNAQPEAKHFPATVHAGDQMTIAGNGPATNAEAVAGPDLHVDKIYEATLSPDEIVKVLASYVIAKNGVDARGATINAKISTELDGADEATCSKLLMKDTKVTVAVSPAGAWPNLPKSIAL